MKTLLRTDLRHRMLTEVSTDQDFEFIPSTGTYDHRGGPLEPNEKRTLTELRKAGLLASGPWAEDEEYVFVTVDGLRLLAEWDEVFGEVSS